nr:MAG TPA: hypothetical protein [Caudoviricetes sp.]
MRCDTGRLLRAHARTHEGPYDIHLYPVHRKV